jgi:hypothetical protein
LRLISEDDPLFEHLRDFVRDAVRGFERRPKVQVLWKLEAMAHRLAYKESFSSPSLLEEFACAVAEKTKRASDEDLVWRAPSVWEERNTWVRKRLEVFWEQAKGTSLQEQRAIIARLAALEAQIDAQFGEEIELRSVKEHDATNYRLYDAPWDYMRSYLFGALAREIDAADALFSEDDLDAVATLLRRVSQDYSVNHADDLWVRLTASRGRIVVAPGVADAVASRLPLDRIGEFLVRHRSSRYGASAFRSGVRVRGVTPPDGGVELELRLDLDRRRVCVESAKSWD